MSIWDYTRTYAPATDGVPVPLEFFVAGRFRHYAKNNVTSFFVENEQGSRGGKVAGDMFEIRYHLISKLMEDPFIDADKVIKDAMLRYYGKKPGEVLYRMRKWYRDLCVARKAFIGWFPMFGEVAFLETADMEKMVKAWDEAERLAAGEEKLLGRIRWSRTGTDAMLASRRQQRALLHEPEEGVSDVVFVDCPAANLAIWDSKGKRHNVPAIDDPDAYLGKAFRAEYNEHLKPPFAMGFYDHTHSEGIISQSFAAPEDGKYHWYTMQDVYLPAVSYYFYLTRSWEYHVTPDIPGCPGGKVRVKAHVKYDGEYVYIDRVVFIPVK